ncbi:ABC transporter ATP-binding protein [Ramlibacter sp. AW1]|uniref:ABC transporter ATP-binding protein n=1 Tax=Ramlibacter aurantiacus TaxID=2801330 RepID=A0A936ZGX4_9BURK|nr:ABC transporter ATP-binding protein [Ramlibacter aurantiacus]MBL0420043.1 ABC transporter ATP-binding protein [Ramlibacter aurantiacus]
MAVISQEAPASAQRTLAATEGPPALAVRGLNKHYGALHVTRDVSLTLERGARHAIIGPNGAGKTTLIHQISGLQKSGSGQIQLLGVDITRFSPERRARHGLARTFQINALFTRLTVMENIGLAVSARHGLDGSLGRPLQSRAQVLDDAAALLSQLGLLDLAERRVAELAYGQRRMVEIALALGTRPRVLLLDEPAAGVPSDEGKRLFDLLDRLPEDVAVLVIEHDMGLVFRFARRITVMVEGQVLVEGSVADIRADPRVREVYLGNSHRD